MKNSKSITGNEATKETMWLKKFISNIGVITNICDLVEILRDNKSKIELAKEL